APGWQRQRKTGRKPVVLKPGSNFSELTVIPPDQIDHVVIEPRQAVQFISRISDRAWTVLATEFQRQGRQRNQRRLPVCSQCRELDELNGTTAFPAGHRRGGFGAFDPLALWQSDLHRIVAAPTGCLFVEGQAVCVGHSRPRLPPLLGTLELLP